MPTAAAPAPAASNVLCATNLPPDYDAAALSVLFRQFESFQEAMLVPGDKRVAFVQFADAAGAAAARERLGGFRLAPGVELALAFANR